MIKHVEVETHYLN